MTILSEGCLQFNFDQSCLAEKYDDWSFYRNQFQSTCGSAKAVDMICLSDDISWLIEIKDYRQHKRTKPQDLGDEVALKVRDTLAGLVAAKMKANDSNEKTFAKRVLPVPGGPSSKIPLGISAPIFLYLSLFSI